MKENENYWVDWRNIHRWWQQLLNCDNRIESLVQDAGMWHFKVQTQRGDAEIYVRNWRDSAYETGAGRWQILSVDGLRFTIPDINALDARSQDLLDQVF